MSVTDATLVFKRSALRGGERKERDPQAHELELQIQPWMSSPLLEGALPPYQQQQQSFTKLSRGDQCLFRGKVSALLHKSTLTVPLHE